ncbi:MAG TPA: DUF4276 family protein [Blastocatellia bacterium]
MPSLVPIVEGAGDASAVPVLLRKILGGLGRYDIAVARAKNANGRGNLDKADGLERFIRYAWKEPDCGAIVVLVDADKECPAELARSYSERIANVGLLFPVVIVCAKRGYETWLVASFETIIGRDLEVTPGPRPDEAPHDAELVPSPAAWITKRMPKGRSYKKSIDQEAMTHRLDVATASARSRSFRRLVHAVEQAINSIEVGQKLVSPEPDMR